MGFGLELVAAFGLDRVRGRAPLAPLTTFGVGGPADWLLESRGAEETLLALRLAHRAGIVVTVLGGGSNVLIGDGGIRGLVLRLRGGAVEALPGFVRAEAGVSINGLVRFTIHHGLSGLAGWAGTPGTVGGGIFGNAHFDGQLLGDLVESACLAGREGTLHDARGEDMAFAYDASRLQRTGEILLSATFRVGRADPPALRAQARRSLLYRKGTQPLNVPSAGCVFKNPDPARDRLPPGVPASAGALLDRAGLKGRAIGGARISPLHANFIVNEGRATAGDVQRLVDLCRQTVAERFGVELQEEIVRLGEFEACPR